LPVVYITGANADEWAVQGVPNSSFDQALRAAQLVTQMQQHFASASAPENPVGIGKQKPKPDSSHDEQRDRRNNI
jgi:hypothetical protein